MTRQVHRAGLLSRLACAWLAAAALGPGAANAEDDARQLLEQAERAYARRAEGAVGAAASAEPIGEAIAAYERAIVLEPDLLGPRVGLLRALYFQGDFATAEAEAKKAAFDRGKQLFEETVAALATRLGAPLPAEAEGIAQALSNEPEAGPLYYWGAVLWGSWGQHFGPFAAVKNGVATKVRDCGEVARQLSPDYEHGAPYRLLGRMHAVAPKVPLFTGWIDHDLAVEYLEEAHRRAGDDPLVLMFLGEALLDHRPASERARGLELLERAATAQPRPGWEVEDTRAIDDAKAALAKRR